MFTISISILLTGVLNQAPKPTPTPTKQMGSILKSLDEGNCYKEADLSNITFSGTTGTRRAQSATNKCKDHWVEAVTEWNRSNGQKSDIKSKFEIVRSLQVSCKESNKRRLQKANTNSCNDAEKKHKEFKDMLKSYLSQSEATKNYFKDSTKKVTHADAKVDGANDTCLNYSKTEWENWDKLDKCKNEVYDWPGNSGRRAQSIKPKYTVNNDCSDYLKKALEQHNKRASEANSLISKLKSGKCTSTRRLKSIMKEKKEKRNLQKATTKNCHKAQRAMYLTFTCLTLTSYVIKISVAAMITIAAMFF